MKNVILVIVGMIVLTGIAAGGSLLLVNLISPNKPESKSNAASQTGDHHSSGSTTQEAHLEDVTKAAKITIDIKDNKYQRPNIKITEGTTISWINRDEIGHNVMKDHTNSGAAHDATKEDNVSERIFSGSEQSKGQTYSYTFNEVGEIEYHCATHPEMRGKITVIDGV